MSNTPISIDLPHQLGAEEARRRIDSRIGSLKDHIPAAADVRAAWSGDRLGLTVAALGQEVNASLDVHETFVRVEVLLPPALGFFRGVVETGLRRGGGALLEDRTRRDG
ncbi:MAG: polyhydroxyalkanoic acid system family protein [Sphingomonas sp.]|nr:polyhydroxyalkanoic acid system family protein [Sphingomonas sp.]